MTGSENNTIGYVNSTESFGAADGPGVRFIFFMQGCPMRCMYCHNPETWSFEGGKEYTPAQALSLACRYRSYWKDGGGITVSGGEPLMQIGFVTELFRLAHENGINTAIDTSGAVFDPSEPFISGFDALMENTDLFILDIKHIDSEKHRILTGRPNGNILAMARYLSDRGKDMWIRYVLVPDVTSGEDDLKRLSQFIGTLKTVRRTEILPYHTLGVPKYKKLGIDYRLNGISPPTAEEIRHASDILGI